MSARGSYYVGSCLISSRGKGGVCRHPSTSTPLPRSCAKSNRMEEGNGGERRGTSPRTTQDRRSAPNYECSRSDGGWAGGLPLISVARGRNFPTCSRLAFGGAPLILSSRGKVVGGGRGGRQVPPEAAGRRRASGGGKEGPAAVSTVYRGSDSVSVASDEGSSSVNSESGLPRIIKPRKRRKKERRPAKAREDAAPEAAPLSDTPRGAALCEHSQETSLEVAVEAVNSEEESPSSSCHCRLCNPFGFIWGVDRSCYSPLPPSPVHSLYRPPPAPPTSEPSAWSSVGGRRKSEAGLEEGWTGGGRNLEVSTEIITSPNGHRDLEIKFYSTISRTLKKEEYGSVARVSSWNAFDVSAAVEE